MGRVRVLVEMMMVVSPVQRAVEIYSVPIRLMNLEREMNIDKT